MPNYQHSDWATKATTALKLESLRLHIAEVSDLMLPDSSGPDHSIDRKSLGKYLETIIGIEERLTKYNDDEQHNPFRRVRLGRR